MTTPLSYPDVNGFRHSFSSIQAKIGNPGIVYQGFKGINYEFGLEPVQVYGFHPDPIGETRGVAKYSGDFEMYLAEYAQIMAALGAGAFTQRFNISVSYIENGYDTITDLLIGARLIKTTVDQSQSGDPLTRKVPMTIMKVLPNGLDILDIPLVGNPS
jgi:hypothetical protein